MSCIWYLVCEETGESVPIGQGYGCMGGLWTGEKEEMGKLADLLNRTAGKKLVFLNEHDLEVWEYERTVKP